MSTSKQKTAFKKVIKNAQEGNPKTMGMILRESGYSVSKSKTPKSILDSKGFQKLLARVDDEVILSRVAEILIDTDKRSALTAADMFLKLKDRYPDKQIKIGAIQQIKDIYE